MKIVWLVLLVSNVLIYYYTEARNRLYLIIASLIYLLYDFGFFTSLSFSKKTFRERTIYYYDFTGDYSFIFNELDKIDNTMEHINLKENKNLAKFGIYYDNPKLVDKTKCRAILGIVAVDIKKEDEEFILRNGYLKDKLPEVECVTTAFPYINKLSISLAVYKFYSELDYLIKIFRIFGLNENFTKSVLEIYTSKSIEFYIFLENAKEFLLHNTFRK